MTIDKKKKAVLKTLFQEKFDKASSAFVAEYRGLSVADLTILRKNLFKVNAEFKVLKNRVAIKAVEGTPHSIIKQSLKGPIGVVYVYGDPAPVAKALVDFAKTNEHFKLTSGLMDAALLSPSQLKMISELPSREVLLGQIAGLLVSPHRSILGILNAVPRSLVQVINAIKEKKA